jgi:hypothetical protein
VLRADAHCEPFRRSIRRGSSRRRDSRASVKRQDPTPTPFRPPDVLTSSILNEAPAPISDSGHPSEWPQREIGSRFRDGRFASFLTPLRKAGHCGTFSDTGTRRGMLNMLSAQTNKPQEHWNASPPFRTSRRLPPRSARPPTPKVRHRGTFSDTQANRASASSPARRGERGRPPPLFDWSDLAPQVAFHCNVGDWFADAGASPISGERPVAGEDAMGVDRRRML